MKFALVVLIAFCVTSSFAWSQEWEKMDKPSPDSQMEITLSLKLNNIEKLEKIFNDVSTPGNEQYGKYRTMEELTELIAPPKFEQNLVILFLEKYGFEAESFGDFILAKGPVSSVERVFDVDVYTFQNTIFKGETLLRAADYPSIPKGLKHIVTFVTGISTFPAEKSSLKRTPVSQNSRDEYTDKWVVPQTIRGVYGIPDSADGSAPGNSMAVVEFGTLAGVSIDDLDQFNQLTDGVENPTLNYTVGNFAFTPIDPVDGESTLDVQYIMSTASAVPTSFWTVNGWVYDFTTLVQKRQLRQLPVPLVFSMSYGWSEADQCAVTGHGTPCYQLGGGSSNYVLATNAQFMKLGATGITLLASSGDAGAASKENLECDEVSTPIQPNFPASSAYLTAVGGTMLQNGGVPLTGDLPPFCESSDVPCAGAGSVEIVSSVPQALITSGGGFSNVIPQPSYQENAVNAWMISGSLSPPSPFFNSSGRAYPDVSALAHKYMIVENGESFAVDGTSASCPVTAGIVALINGARLNAGKSPVGPLNNALYAAPGSAFNDITIGDNTHTESPNTCTTFGYGAGPSWDPCTGFGTPVYTEWLDYFMNM